MPTTFSDIAGRLNNEITCDRCKKAITMAGTNQGAYIKFYFEMRTPAFTTNRNYCVDCTIRLAQLLQGFDEMEEFHA